MKEIDFGDLPPLKEAPDLEEYILGQAKKGKRITIIMLRDKCNISYSFARKTLERLTKQGYLKVKTKPIETNSGIRWMSVYERGANL